MTLTMNPERLGKDRILGLRQEWLSGEGDTFTFSLDSGAGLGSPALTLTVKLANTDTGEPTVITEIVDIRDVAKQWVDKILESLG